MDNLTQNLDSMIYHQRQAERAEGELQEWHYREALRYRLLAYKLRRQAIELRRSVGGWLNLN